MGKFQGTGYVDPYAAKFNMMRPAAVKAQAVAPKLEIQLWNVYYYVREARNPETLARWSPRARPADDAPRARSPTSHRLPSMPRARR